MERIKTFFWWCSGAHIGSLQQYPYDESKYMGIGTAVFFTGLFAAISSSYALYFVFDIYYIAIGFGILWGLFIFSLDRFIVGSMRKSGKWRNDLALTLPRLFLAILISLVIATPLELKIFEKEINVELQQMESEKLMALETTANLRFQADREIITNEIAKLNSGLESKTLHRNALRDAARSEADGTGGSRIRNAGPIYQLKKKDADQADMELLQFKLETDQLLSIAYQKLTDIDANRAAALAAISQNGVNSGLASRLEALSRITAASTSILFAHLFLVLLFIVVETAPILVKLLSSAGGYDYAVNADEYAKRTEYFTSMVELRKQSAKGTQGLSEAEQVYVNDRLSLENL